MTTPALRALKESRPGRRLTLLTSPSGAAVAAMVPEVDDCWTYQAPWMKATAGRSDPAADLAMIARLRDGGFDAAVIFTVYSQNPLPAAMACYLAGIPLRLAHCRENAYQLLTDRIAEPEPAEFTRHEARRQLDLVAAVGARAADERLSLRVPDEARSRVAALIDRLGLDDGRPWAVVHPGATASSRRYAPEGFAAAAGALARDHGFRIVFTGDRAEIPLVAWIREGMGAPSHSLAGKLRLAELAALIERAPVLISNNTGPAHVAAAVGTPVVDLYALTNPQHTPWAVPSRVLNHPVPCAPCYKSVCPEGHHDCLRRVDPAEVVRAALELVAEGRPSRLASSPAAMPSR
ncbi:glycosyltransferase family 9 protein [Tundrisphaera sp. TA3]|uniref:glycosyltransferase family 9 protein n=1 Tax=Tundrisphaera sp. TA3 TaxID=3435775 RepID=UPI003EBF3F06